MQTQKTLIKPPSGLSLGMKELWHYRELFYFFTWRDLKVRYKQTLIGVVWVILQPLVMMLIFHFIISNTLRPELPISMPYPLFVLSGLILWNLFNSSVLHAGESMIQHSNIIRKIYFPRLIIPGSAILVSFIDFIIAFILFLAVTIIYGYTIHWYALIYFPVAVILCMVAAFGLGCLLAAMNVKFRDFRYALPFLLQILFFCTQVLYPAILVRDTTLQKIFFLNPVNGAIELFRSALTGIPPDPVLVSISAGFAIFLVIIGLIYFRKTEYYFADLA